MRGQATILLLGVMLLSAALIVGLATLAWQRSEHWRLQHVADSAARAGSMVLARNLNFQALTNRALIANQVVIAQLVGIQSWFAMLKDGSQRTALVTSWVPYLNALMVKLMRITVQFERLLSHGLRTLISLQQAIIQALSVAQRAAHLAFVGAANRTIGDIIEQQVDGVKWEAWHVEHGLPIPYGILWWPNLTTVSTRQARASEFVTLTQQSRDKFSQARSYDWLKVAGIKLSKAGGTELKVLDDGRWNWQGLDTTSLHLRWLFLRTELSWARGAKQLRPDSYQRSTTVYGESGKRNPKATSDARRLATAMGTVLLPFSYTAVARGNLLKPPKVIVRLQQFGTSNEIVSVAVAGAEVFYSRPNELFRRVDGRQERGNLFNPLWQSRLMPLSQLERLLLGFTWPSLS